MEPQGDLHATADAGAVTPLPSTVAGGDESAPNPSSPPRGTDLAADESLEDTASPEPREPSEEDDADQEQEPDNGQVDHSSGTAAVTADDLKRKIIKQVEYYFSDENLPTDKYLMGFIKKNKEGYVPTGVIASFRKMKKLTRDHAVIVAALKESTCLVVNPDGKKVKRLNPLPVVEQRDPKLFTVLVENLPDDHSVHNLRRIFGEVGRIKNVCIHDPSSAEESKKGSKVVDKLYSSKLHALVEYDSAEAAEKAANTLNNEQDWRNGMRVKLLKRVTMYGNRRQAWTGGPDTEKKTAGRPSDHVGDGERKLNENHEDITPDEESGDRGSKDKSGDKVRNYHGNNNNNTHGRGGRKHKQQNRGGLNGGHGHGIITAGLNSSHSEAPSKPPPGPRMPDGTRGFAMGRGKPL